MSRGLGRIGQAIAHQIERARQLDTTGRPGTVLISSWDLLCDVYGDHTGGWRTDAYDFTPAQRKAVVRSMNSYVRKHQQFALIGGQGRKRLYLYEPGDPLSAMWAKLQVDNRARDPITRSEARTRLEQQMSACP